MKAYLLSLLAGGLVGIVYGLVGVRSPAPPVVALVGLPGILVGEQVVPTARRLIADPAGATATTPSPTGGGSDTADGGRAGGPL